MFIGWPTNVGAYSKFIVALIAFLLFLAQKIWGDEVIDNETTQDVIEQLTIFVGTFAVLFVPNQQTPSDAAKVLAVASHTTKE